MSTSEVNVEVIASSLPHEGDELSFRITDNLETASRDYEASKLRVDLARPLGQKACRIEGIIIPDNESFTADLVYGDQETTLSTGRIVIYHNEED